LAGTVEIPAAAKNSRPVVAQSRLCQVIRNRNEHAIAVSWHELPESVRDAVEAHTGPVSGATDITNGCSSDIAARLDRTGLPPVFLKGVHGVSRRMRFLRNEITGNGLAAGIAPAVLFSQDVHGWLVVGFEHIAGRPASFVPGSPDLDLVAATLETISGLPAPGVRNLRQRWENTDSWQIAADQAPESVEGFDLDEMAKWAALVPELVDGDRLLHTDLHPDQFLITDSGRLYVIDWGFPGAGAQWVDTAFLVLRLIWAGHSPAEAERWAGARSTWAGLDEKTITAFAVYVAGLWSEFTLTDRSSGAEQRARLARDYAVWRLGKGCSAVGPDGNENTESQILGRTTTVRVWCADTP
jgi:hypothetical protein